MKKYYSNLFGQEPKSKKSSKNDFHLTHFIEGHVWYFLKNTELD